MLRMPMKSDLSNNNSQRLMRNMLPMRLMQMKLKRRQKRLYQP